MADFRKYEEMIESTIDLNEIKNHLYLVKSTFDPDLEGDLESNVEARLNLKYIFPFQKCKKLRKNWTKSNRTWKKYWLR